MVLGRWVVLCPPVLCIELPSIADSSTISWSLAKQQGHHGVCLCSGCSHILSVHCCPSQQILHLQLLQLLHLLVLLQGLRWMLLLLLLLLLFVRLCTMHECIAKHV